MYTRRDFIRDLGRGALALGLGGGLAALVGREGLRCEQGCGGCAELAKCGKAQAVAARQMKAKDILNG